MSARSLDLDEKPQEGERKLSFTETFLTKTLQPFPEAVVSQPVIQGKLRQVGAFENESLEEFYKPIDSYEGVHRYDPDFQWEPKEEQRLVRKCDIKVCFWVCFMFFALQLDRGNIVQALSDDMLTDINVTTDDYDWGQTMFYLFFLFAELPSQLISKKLGPVRQLMGVYLLQFLRAFADHLALAFRTGGSRSRWSLGLSWLVCRRSSRTERASGPVALFSA